MAYNITKVSEYIFLNKDEVFPLDSDYILASDEHCIKIYDLSYKEIWEIKFSKKIQKKTYANNILIIFTGNEWIKYNILEKTEEVLSIIADIIYIMKDHSYIITFNYSHIMKDFPYMITFNDNKEKSKYIVNILNYNTNELINGLDINHYINSIKNYGDIIIFNHSILSFTVYNLKNKRIETIDGKFLDIFNEIVYFSKPSLYPSAGALYIYQNDEIISKNINIIDYYYIGIVLNESWLIIVDYNNIVVLLNTDNNDRYILQEYKLRYRNIIFSSDKSKIFYIDPGKNFKEHNFNFKGYKAIISNIEFIDIK
jgi:hypothetical protein